MVRGGCDNSRKVEYGSVDLEAGEVVVVLNLPQHAAGFAFGKVLAVVALAAESFG
jgi:hypothetical protein